MTDRDQLASLIRPYLGGSDNTLGGGWAEHQARYIADAILADGWRWVGTMECMHRPHHDIERGDTHCCGLPLVPREEA